MQLVLYTAVFLAILVFINLFAQQYHKRFDFTASKRYTLSPQSVKVLKKLKQEVNVIGFFSSGTEKNRAKELLEQYAYYSQKFKYTFIDPDRHPLEAKKYNVTHYNTLVVMCGKKREQIYELSEEKLTNAIIRVTRKETKTIYFLSGHGEHDINDAGKSGYSEFKTALTDKGFEVKNLLLVKEPSVPKDAALVIIAGPQKELLKKEVECLEDYLKKGGHLFFLLDPETSEELKRLLHKEGIVLHDDIIVDKMSRLFGGDYLIPVIMRYAPDHPITKDFKLACFFPLTRSVEVGEKLPKDIQAKVLAWTSENAWGETDINLLKTANQAGFDKDDVAGPVPVAVAAWSEQKTGFKIVVVGDSDFISNTYLNLSGNKDLALNIISWLTAEKDLISIPPKKTATQPLVLSRTQAQVIFWLPVVAVPLSILAFGFIVYLRRRKL